MFRLLSKESNIFSIPIYIGFLLLIVISFNILHFNTLDGISAIITFLAISLGYFVFNTLKLNSQRHLPLFLYTFFVFAFYPGNLNIGISTALLCNSFLLLILTSENEYVRKSTYVLVGSLLALNYLFLPTSWPMILFIFLHIIGTSERVGLNIFRTIFGFMLILMSYFGVMYFLDFRSWDLAYFPFKNFVFAKDFYPLYFLIPIIMMLLYAVIDHFNHYNSKSPISKFKYTFLLLFTAAQCTTIVLYMGKTTEYLLLIVLPATIIISRMLRFFPKYWMKELFFWMVIACLIVFKLSDYLNFNIL